MKTGFYGGGQMTEAILAGALKAGVLRAEDILVTDINPQRLEHLRATYGAGAIANDETNAGLPALTAECGAVVLAIKPQLAQRLLAGAGGCFGPHRLVVSIMGGVALQTLEGFAPDAPVVRVMPNLPALVGRGSTGLSPGTRAGAGHVEWCEKLFGAVGGCTVVPENQLDALTAVSGCGPAFAALFAEALADGGVRQGLPRETALRLAAETLAGTAELLLQTSRHPAQLKDSVCSPGGGTIAGVHALENRAFRAAVMDAVAAARERMGELG